MAKIPSSKLSDKTSKKTGVVMVISVGGKAPKKPTKTADTEKAGQCGVVKKGHPHDYPPCECGGEFTLVDTQQMRSAEEAPTQIFQCSNCAKTVTLKP